MKTRWAKTVLGVVAISSPLAIQVPSAFAATTPLRAVGNQQSFTVNGQLIQVQKMADANPSDNVVRVTVHGKTTTATYNKTTNTMTIQNPNGTQQSFNLTGNSASTSSQTPSHISPNYITESVSEGWWGDMAQDHIISGPTQYWQATINGTTSWSGAETSNNSAALNNFWNAVSTTQNAEYAFYALIGSAGAAGIVAVITSETGVAAVVAAVVAAGFTVAAGYQAAQAWTDHHTDVVDYYQIPGV